MEGGELSRDLPTTDLVFLCGENLPSTDSGMAKFVFASRGVGGPSVFFPLSSLGTGGAFVEEDGSDEGMTEF